MNQDSTDWDEEEAISAAFKPGPEVMNLALPSAGEKRIRSTLSDDPSPPAVKRAKVEEAPQPEGSQTPKVERHRLDEVILPTRKEFFKQSRASTGQSTHADEDHFDDPDP